MGLIDNFFTALLDLSLAMSPYLLFGFLFAGILHTFVPDNLVKEHLGSSNIASVIKSTIFGIPLPVCSCGVVPLVMSIKKSGASDGATLSFLISTPITGVDSILATYGIFGWIFTLYRIISSMVIAVVAGIITNIMSNPKALKQKFSQEAKKPLLMTKPPKKEESKSCCSSNSSCCESEAKNSSKLEEIFKYAFVTLFKDIAPSLFWGLLIGALITTLMPSDLSQLLEEYQLLSYIIVIAIALPMYVCATASLPIAASLMLSGVSAGAAFIFLSAGPATNTVTMGVVKKMLGSRTLYIYLGVISVGSIVFALILDEIFDFLKIVPKTLVHFHESYGVMSYISAIIIWGLVLFFVSKKYLKRG